MPNNDYIKWSDVLKAMCENCIEHYVCNGKCDDTDRLREWEAGADGIQKIYTAHEVAEIIAEVIGDDCACDVNGNDEWLPEFCEFSQTVCPDPAGVACWEQWLKWRDKRPKEENDDLD